MTVHCKNAHVMCVKMAGPKWTMRLLTWLQMHCSWLPLSLGGATYHVPACPSMSYFLASGTDAMDCVAVMTPLHYLATLLLGCHNLQLDPPCLLAALLSLGFFFLHTASMMLSFMGLEAGDWLLIAAPPALHVAASLLVSSLSLFLCNWLCSMNFALARVKPLSVLRLLV